MLYTSINDSDPLLAFLKDTALPAWVMCTVGICSDNAASVAPHAENKSCASGAHGQTLTSGSRESEHGELCLGHIATAAHRVMQPQGNIGWAGLAGRAVNWHGGALAEMHVVKRLEAMRILKSFFSRKERGVQGP